MKRNPIASRAERYYRSILLRYLSDVLPLIVVTEHPKSGGSWLCQMLADYLGIPFPRNQWPPLRSCVMHGHYLKKDLGGRNHVVLVRDGRDVMVSWYYHCFFVNDRFNERFVGRMKRLCPFEDYRDIKKNLSKFIEFVFSSGMPLGFNWAQFINEWLDEPARIIRYEKLLSNGRRELAKALNIIAPSNPDEDSIREIIERYSFRKLTGGRRAGEQKVGSFLRSGTSGGWKEHFTSDSLQCFEHYAGEEMEALGYI